MYHPFRFSGKSDAAMLTRQSAYTLRTLSLEERERLGCVVLVMRRWPHGIRRGNRIQFEPTARPVLERTSGISGSNFS